jgi:hypothetical protein
VQRVFRNLRRKAVPRSMQRAAISAVCNRGDESCSSRKEAEGAVQEDPV